VEHNGSDLNGYADPTEFISRLGGLRAALAHVLKWPVSDRAARVAAAVLCLEEASDKGHERASLADIGRAVGASRNSYRVRAGLRELLDGGWITANSTPRRKRVFFFRAPSPARAHDAPPLCAGNRYLRALAAAVRQQQAQWRQRAIAGNTWLVQQLDLTLGADPLNHRTWCKMQSIVTKALARRLIKGTKDALERWIVDRARQALRDEPNNAAAVFTRWFRSQPAFARIWLRQGEKA